MKQKNKDQGIPVLADMHTDGVRFDSKQAKIVNMHNQQKSAEAIQGQKM